MGGDTQTPVTDTRAVRLPAQARCLGDGGELARSLGLTPERVTGIEARGTPKNWVPRRRSLPSLGFSKMFPYFFQPRYRLLYCTTHATRPRRRKRVGNGLSHSRKRVKPGQECTLGSSFGTPTEAAHSRSRA